MTTLLLIRHGDTDAVGKLLAGWMPSWHLNARGREQAENLAVRLARLPLAAVFTSPLERAIETAEPIARRHGLEPRRVEEIGEVRVGEWEGKTFAELQEDAHWAAYNSRRTSVRPPGGELMIEVQTRMVRQAECLAVQYPNQTVAMVSHGDPLRLLVAYFLGIPLDLMTRFEIGTASLSILQLAEWGSRVLCINQTGELPL